MNPGIDQHVVDIEIVKEQIIDLNDKFDFLINLLIKNNKMGVQKKENDSEFVIGDAQVSINSEPLQNEDDILNYVKEFETKARMVTGQDRVKFRKVPPLPPLSKRVYEAKKKEEEKENKKNK